MSRHAIIPAWALILIGILVVLGWRRVVVAGDAILDAVMPRRRR